MSPIDPSKIEYMRPSGLHREFSAEISPRARTRTINFSVDLGPSMAMSSLGAWVQDLTHVVELGIAWGRPLAIATAGWDLENARSWGEVADDAFWDHQPWRTGLTEQADERLHPFSPSFIAQGSNRWSMFQDRKATVLLGEAPRVLSLRYGSPLTLTIDLGFGTLGHSVERILTIIRDWSFERRAASAKASSAEDRARLETQLTDEAVVASKMRIRLMEEALGPDAGGPIAEYLALITPLHARAIGHLASQPVELSKAGDIPTPKD